MTSYRSDDYYEGLQAAYKVVHKLFQQSTSADRRFAYQNAMSAINQEIDAACENKSRIIIP